MARNVAEPSVLNRVLRFRDLGILVAVLAVLAGFSVYRPLYFPTESNAINIVFYAGPLAFVALAQSWVLLVGEVDLSLGATYVATACFYASLVTYHGVNIWVGLFATLGFGALLGFTNGFITVRSRIPSLIVTLGTMLVYQTVALLLTGGTQVGFYPNVQGSLFHNAFGGFIIGSRTQLPGIPTEVLWVAVAGIAFYFLLNKTKFGNWQVAVGDRPWAALTSGIPVRRVKILSFILCSLCATLASILTLSQISGISPVGSSLVIFESIGAAVIGGTSLFGGSASILGAILGATLIGTIENGVEVVGASVYLYQAAIGAVIVIAAVVNVVIKKRAQRA